MTSKRQRSDDGVAPTDDWDANQYVVAPDRGAGNAVTPLDWDTNRSVVPLEDPGAPRSRLAPNDPGDAAIRDLESNNSTSLIDWDTNRYVVPLEDLDRPLSRLAPLDPASYPDASGWDNHQTVVPLGWDTNRNRAWPPGWDTSRSVVPLDDPEGPVSGATASDLIGHVDGKEADLPLDWAALAPMRDLGISLHIVDLDVHHGFVQPDRERRPTRGTLADAVRRDL